MQQENDSEFAAGKKQKIRGSFCVLSLLKRFNGRLAQERLILRKEKYFKTNCYSEKYIFFRYKINMFKLNNCEHLKTVGPQVTSDSKKL